MRTLLAAAAIAAVAAFGTAPHAEATCVTGLACTIDGCTGTVNVCPTAESCTGTVDVCPIADPSECSGNVDVCLDLCARTGLCLAAL